MQDLREEVLDRYAIALFGEVLDFIFIPNFKFYYFSFNLNSRRIECAQSRMHAEAKTQKAESANWKHHVLIDFYEFVFEKWK